MMPFVREWYLEFKNDHTRWRACYSVHESVEGISNIINNPQFVYLGNATWLNKIHLRGLHEIIRDHEQHAEMAPPTRQYRLVNINTGEIIPGELFA